MSAQAETTVTVSAVNTKQVNGRNGPATVWELDTDGGKFSTFKADIGNTLHEFAGKRAQITFTRVPSNNPNFPPRQYIDRILPATTPSQDPGLPTTLDPSSQFPVPAPVKTELEEKDRRIHRQSSTSNAARFLDIAERMVAKLPQEQQTLDNLLLIAEDLRNRAHPLIEREIQFYATGDSPYKGASLS